MNKGFKHQDAWNEIHQALLDGMDRFHPVIKKYLDQMPDG